MKCGRIFSKTIIRQSLLFGVRRNPVIGVAMKIRDYYYMWKAYHQAREAEPKDSLLFARILAMIADESRSICDNDRYRKYVKPSLDAYELAMQNGQEPTEKELEKIRFSADSLSYTLEREHAPYDEQMKFIVGYEKLENLDF